MLKLYYSSVAQDIRAVYLPIVFYYNLSVNKREHFLPRHMPLRHIMRKIIRTWACMIEMRCVVIPNS